MCLNGSGNHLHIFPESSFGATPESPGYIFLPVETYDVKPVRDRRTANPYFGSDRRKHGQTSTYRVEGSMSGALYPYFPSGGTKSLAQSVMELAWGNEVACSAPSIGAEWAEGPNVANVRHNGLKARQMTISGSAQSGRWDYSLDLLGKSESALATAQTVPANLNQLREFNFAGSVFLFAPIVEGVIGEYTEINLESVQLVRALGTQHRYGGKTTPHTIYRGQKQTTLTVTLDKANDNWRAAARALTEGGVDEFAWTIILLGNHNGTGTNTYTRVKFQINRAQLIDPADTYAIDNLTQTQLSFDCLLPDAALPEIAVTYDTSDAAIDPPGEGGDD